MPNKGEQMDPAARARLREHWADPTRRAEARAHALKGWADPEFRARQEAANASPEVHAKRSEAARRREAARRAARPPKPPKPQLSAKTIAIRASQARRAANERQMRGRLHEDIPRLPGVYALLSYTGRTEERRLFYVGSAADCLHRVYQHEVRLQKGTHKNPLLQEAWNNGTRFVGIVLGTRA